MSLISHILDLLASNAGLQAIIGANTDADPARVYPVQILQGSDMPCLVVNRVSSVRSYSLIGQDGYSQARIQIDAWAGSYTALNDDTTGLAVLVRKILSGYKGERKGTYIGSCLSVNERDFYEPESRNHRVSMDFQLWYREDN